MTSLSIFEVPILESGEKDWLNGLENKIGIGSFGFKYLGTNKDLAICLKIHVIMSY